MKVRQLQEMLTSCFRENDDIAIIFYTKDEFEDEEEISAEIWHEVVEEFDASSPTASIDQQMREHLEMMIREKDGYEQA